MINWRYVRDQAEDLLMLAGFVAILILAVCGAVYAFRGDNCTNHVEYHGKRINMVQAAAIGAAQCGGYLIIDVDDGEALVGGCDK